MSSPLPSVSVIIPSRPGQAEVASVAAARGLVRDGVRLEILLARGRQPSVQRNAALRAARGDLIYFLDDDALPPPGALQRALPHFQDPSVQVVGGPSLCPPDAPMLEQVFATTLGSWLAFGPSRARYQRVGRARASGEKELILCNMLARRDTVLRHGGFDESLYPNEENALMDAIAAEGGRMIYDPEVWIHRRPRPSIGAFTRMVFTYGRGRAEQFRLHPTPGSAANLVPPLFCLHLALLPLTGRLGMMLLLPYVAALLAQGVLSARDHGVIRSLLSLPLVTLTHLGYGLGFWKGLFTRVHSKPRPAAGDIVVEIVQPMS